MLVTAKNGLSYSQFESFAEHGLVQGIFTRNGGVSLAPWRSLNVGGTVGDDPSQVHENRKRMFETVGLSQDSAYDVWQVHSATVVCTQVPRLPGQAHLQADAILTDRPGVSLFMRFADCVPIMLHDPRHGVVGLVHAGWQGTVKRVVQAAVAEMVSQYRSNPEDILAGIGPSIGPDHYQVGADVIRQVQETFGIKSNDLLSGGSFHDQPCQDRLQFNLWDANRILLEQSGVGQIEVAGVCTACHLHDWYSHRAENGRTGRFGAIISMI